MAEIGLPDPGSHDEVVVAILKAIAADPGGLTRRPAGSKSVTSAITQSTFLYFLSRSRSGAAILPSDMIPVAHW